MPKPKFGTRPYEILYAMRQTMPATNSPHDADVHQTTQWRRMGKEFARLDLIPKDWEEVVQNWRT